jgi:hypothetical protein
MVDFTEQIPEHVVPEVRENVTISGAALMLHDIIRRK